MLHFPLWLTHHAVQCSLYQQVLFPACARQYAPDRKRSASDKLPHCRHSIVLIAAINILEGLECYSNKRNCYLDWCMQPSRTCLHACSFPAVNAAGSCSIAVLLVYFIHHTGGEGMECCSVQFLLLEVCQLRLWCCMQHRLTHLECCSCCKLQLTVQSVAVGDLQCAVFRVGGNALCCKRVGGTCNMQRHDIAVGLLQLGSSKGRNLHATTLTHVLCRRVGAHTLP